MTITELQAKAAEPKKLEQMKEEEERAFEEIVELISKMSKEELVCALECIKNPEKKENTSQEMTLFSVVSSRYQSISDFAKAIGWTYSKAYKTINHERLARLSDMEQFIAHFGLSPEAVTPLFFGTMFQ